MGHQVISDNQEQWISSEESFFCISLTDIKERFSLSSKLTYLTSKPYQIENWTEPIFWGCFIRNSLLAWLPSISRPVYPAKQFLCWDDKTTKKAGGKTFLRPLLKISIEKPSNFDNLKPWKKKTTWQLNSRNETFLLALLLNWQFYCSKRDDRNDLHFSCHFRCRLAKPYGCKKMPPPFLTTIFFSYFLMPFLSS